MIEKYYSFSLFKLPNYIIYNALVFLYHLHQMEFLIFLIHIFFVL